MFFLDHDGAASSTEKKKSKNKQPEKNRHIRMAGGTTWKDETLGEWDPGKRNFSICSNELLFFS